MSDIISQLRKSNVKLLETEGADLAKWSKLKHVKEDLELFLQFNVAQIQFKTKMGADRTIICTSNTPLITILSTKKKADKKKFVNFKNPGIRCSDKHIVNTWDLEANKEKSINLKSWSIINFVSISPDNVLIIDEILQNLLKL